MTPQDVLKLVEEKEVKFVDFRFTDTRGKEQHVGVPISAFSMDKFEDGHAFDGSSIAGWKGIQASDMQLMPDAATAYIDPFFDETTLVLTCDVVEPADGKGYDRDPRSIAKRAEAYLKSSGIGDTAYFGPEPEFFIFDSIEWGVDMSGAHVKIFSEEAAWSSSEKFEGGNTGHRPTSRAAISRCPRSTASTTCAPRCACCWKPAACRSKCITTKSPPPARTKSAPCSTPWCAAPTRPSC
jgi:glutamine synthetase